MQTPIEIAILHCPASCSESFELTRSLWDAAGVRLALLSAAEAARVLGEDESVIERWQKRADEIKDAIIADEITTENFCEYWWIWPSRVLPWDDPRMRTLAAVLREKLQPGLNKEEGVTGIFYYGWFMTTLGRVWSADQEKMAELKRAIRIYTDEVPTPGTHHMGDDFLLIPDGEGGVKYLNVTTTPNAFSSTNVYIAAMAAYTPDLFDAIEKEGSAVEPRKGCACGMDGAQEISLFMAAFLFLLCHRFAMRNFSKRARND